MLTQIDLIKKYRIAVRGHVGQHLLIDPNMQRKIVNLLEISKGDTVFEIGPGLGALTGRMIEQGCGIIAVEKDKKFVEILNEELGASVSNRIKIIQGDILKCDLAGILADNGLRGRKIKVISNLPYYITAPVLFYLIERRDLLSRAVLTLQKEVGDRMDAQPGSKDYGRLSVGVRYAASVRRAFNIPPQCFTPRPAVDSATVVLDFDRPRLERKGEEKIFSRVVRTAFCQRRKTLFHNLMCDRGFSLTREVLAETFLALGFKKMVRGEELLLKDYLALTDVLKGVWRNPEG
jgi:16S rRNA (adenine1518-N6/adenine1519-N6)-dimethyltransferase